MSVTTTATRTATAIATASASATATTTITSTTTTTTTSTAYLDNYNRNSHTLDGTRVGDNIIKGLFNHTALNKVVTSNLNNNYTAPQTPLLPGKIITSAPTAAPATSNTVNGTTSTATTPSATTTTTATTNTAAAAVNVNVNNNQNNNNSTSSITRNGNNIVATFAVTTAAASNNTNTSINSASNTSDNNSSFTLDIQSTTNTTTTATTRITTQTTAPTPTPTPTLAASNTGAVTITSATSLPTMRHLEASTEAAFPAIQTVATTFIAGNKNRATTIIVYPTVTPESIVIPIVSCIFGFPILALIVICCLRRRAKLARERDRRRNYDMQDHAVSLVRFSPIHRLNYRSSRAISLRPERSLSQGFTSLELDTVLEERCSDIEQTQTEIINAESPLESSASCKMSFSSS